MLARNRTSASRDSSDSLGSNSPNTLSWVSSVWRAFRFHSYSARQKKVRPPGTCSMSSVFTPRSRSTAYSSSPKSSPTGPTTRTSVKKLAAKAKWTAEPPSMRSRSPNGVLTASNAIDPTTTRVMPLSLMADTGHMTTGAIVFIALLALVVLWAIVAYNSLVRSRNKVDEAWSGIDVQLKRRHDLVPNLVETVKGYAAHERETLQAVTEARSAAAAAGEPRAIERTREFFEVEVATERAVPQVA